MDPDPDPGGQKTRGSGGSGTPGTYLASWADGGVALQRQSSSPGFSGRTHSPVPSAAPASYRKTLRKKGTHFPVFRIRKFLGLADQDLLVRATGPNLDPSIIKKNSFVTS